MESSGSVERSRASPFSAKRIFPETRACNGNNRMMASDVIDLPEPDSPTRPRTSPCPMEKLRSRTAASVGVGTAAPGRPAAGEKSIFRLRTSSSAGTEPC